jgi:hypothetical protein
MADHETPHARQRQLPSIGTAAARHHVLSAASKRHGMGCMFMLAAAAAPVAIFLAVKIGTIATSVVGMALVVVGVATFISERRLAQEGQVGRLETVIGGLFMAAAGLGVVLMAALLWLGVVASGWTVATPLILLGIALFYSARPGVWRRYLDEKRLELAEKHVGHSGCRIAFFRPFRNEKLSTLARNCLVPLLNGYGSVFFVADETYDAAKPEIAVGSWVTEYSEQPELIGGRPRFDVAWQRHVLEALEGADIAVVDVSVPSVNVLWEIKQCYDLLPAHRVLFVANADHILDEATLNEAYDLTYGRITHDPDVAERIRAKVERSLQEHIKNLMNGLRSFEDIKRGISPTFLVYFANTVGRKWFEGALHNFMERIVVIEKGESEDSLLWKLVFGVQSCVYATERDLGAAYGLEEDAVMRLKVRAVSSGMITEIYWNECLMVAQGKAARGSGG